MRTLAIGDVHGCGNALETLLDYVGPTVDDRLIFLGDYVDRGERSRDVVKLVRQFRKSHGAICLRGNHEEMMIEALFGDEQSLAFWLRLGGLATLRSYVGPSFDDGGAGLDIHNALKRIDEDDIMFIQDECVDVHVEGNVIFAHGGVVANVRLEDQEPSTLRWKRFDEHSGYPGYHLVVGHTPQRGGEPVRTKGGAVCIDTFCYGGGWLSCLDVDANVVFQANEAREVRTLPVPPCDE